MTPAFKPRHLDEVPHATCGQDHAVRLASTFGVAVRQSRLYFVGGRTMTLAQLRIFVAVADYQHMTRAAHSLDLAQSAVSKAVALLEGEVGFRLFDRVGRNIRLTVAGTAYRDEALALLAAADRLVEWASMQHARLVAPRSSIGLEPTAAQKALARSFACSAPSITLSDRSPCRTDHARRSVGAFRRNGH